MLRYYGLIKSSALDLKIKIETLDNKGNYLLYAPYYEPEPEKDWLLDIRVIFLHLPRRQSLYPDE